MKIWQIIVIILLVVVALLILRHVSINGGNGDEHWALMGVHLDEKHSSQSSDYARWIPYMKENHPDVLYYTVDGQCNKDSMVVDKCILMDFNQPGHLVRLRDGFTRKRWGFGGFDKIIFDDSVIKFMDLNQFLKGLLSALKPGGEIYVPVEFFYTNTDYTKKKIISTYGEYYQHVQNYYKPKLYGQGPLKPRQILLGKSASAHPTMVSNTGGKMPAEWRYKFYNDVFHNHNVELIKSKYPCDIEYVLDVKNRPYPAPIKVHHADEVTIVGEHGYYIITKK